jgi:tetraacyldisaccharide 4'-kinase
LPQFEMRLVGQRFVAAAAPVALRDSCDAAPAGTANCTRWPGSAIRSRFFRQLQALGLEFEEHPFPDHHPYTAADLAFARTACC